MTAAVLLAGGTGSRIGAELPKQLIPLAGRPMLEHSLATFSEHPGIDEIVVVMAPGHLEAARSLVSRFPLVTQVISGGATRSESTMRALDALAENDLAENALVLFHDAARPLVTARIISDCLSALETHDAVGTVVPAVDTVWAVDADGGLAGIPTRAGLRRAQTPQGFRVSTLREAYARAMADPDFEATDDCAVVFRYTPEVPIALVAGDESNLKVTDPFDLVIAEHLLAQRART